MECTVVLQFVLFSSKRKALTGRFAAWLLAANKHFESNHMELSKIPYLQRQTHSISSVSQEACSSQQVPLPKSSLSTQCRSTWHRVLRPREPEPCLPQVTSQQCAHPESGQVCFTFTLQASETFTIWNTFAYT